MAYKKKSSAIEDLIGVVSLTPWWVGVALAAISYSLLHGIASKGVEVSAQPGTAASLVMQAVIPAVAGIGQYAVPAICMAGAFVSIWRRHKPKALASAVAHSPSADALEGMSWQQFELLVGEGFRLQGYTVLETGGAGPDGGVDLVLRKGTEKFVVQCKQWKAFKVGVDVVRELYGVMAARGSAGGFVVTSGTFTDDATRWASGRNITLIDGKKLHKLISASVRDQTREKSKAPAEILVRDDAPGVGSREVGCPICSKPMALRTAKRGANAGGAFYGCTAYPSCKGTRPGP